VHIGDDRLPLNNHGMTRNKDLKNYTHNNLGDESEEDYRGKLLIFWRRISSILKIFCRRLQLEK
jgi:hypothetical protein